MLPENQIVAIIAVVNSKYVSAENGVLNANKNVAQISEKFEMSFYE